MYETEEDVLRVIRGFATCETPAGEFHHREHLTVAVWYLTTLSRDDALKQMRSALWRFLDHHGVDRKKYREDLTVFWLDAVASQLDKIGPQAGLLEKCNQVIGAFVSSTARTPAARVGVEE
jgi:hypothetical protein